MSKFLILTDSIGNPRVFPASEITQLEETYPYIIRNHFPNAVFWQCPFGNIPTEKLVSQAAGYLSIWNPDVVIIQSGIIDCRPEAFTEFEKTIVNKLAGPFSKYIKRYLYNPSLIRHRQVHRVSKSNFRKTDKKLKLLFEESKIFWIEICAKDAYENARPGVQKRIEEYNQIIEHIYGKNMIRVKKKLLELDGFNIDNMHWNKRGHEAVADILIDRIKNEGEHVQSE